MIKVGIVGYGYWGPNLARATAETDCCAVAAIADFSDAARDRAGRRHPSARLHADWKALVNDPGVDAVAIATPVHTHFDIALAALKAGKHVLVEKPMTDSPQQAALLVEEAAKRRLTLMVDHTFVYTGAIQAIRGMVDAGELGDLFYYDSTRVNLGLVQRDVNVIWDLAVHDFAIMDHLLDATPIAISASSAGFIQGRPNTMAHLTVHFAGGALAHLNVNWLSPVKIRQTILGGSKKMVIYDDMESSEKVKIYDRGVEISADPKAAYQQMVSYRIGDMRAPALSTKEALVTEMQEFARSIDTGSRPLTDGETGLRVVELLAAATRSSAMRGQPVELGGLRKAS